VDSQSANDLLETMRSGLLSPAQIVMAAKLLTEEAAVLEALDAPADALPRRRKALRLFLEIRLGPGCPSLDEFFSHIDELIEKTASEGLPLESARLLPDYYEQSGRFGLAEDAYFLLGREAVAGDPVFADGSSFYARLIQFSDEELLTGGLPRDEVEDGARAWRELEQRGAA
jgi:hypothetical protein